MKTFLTAALATAVLSTSAAAGNFATSLPSLTFPPAETVTVAKDCIVVDATSLACVTEE